MSCDSQWQQITDQGQESDSRSQLCFLLGFAIFCDCFEVLKELAQAKEPTVLRVLGETLQSGEMEPRGVFFSELLCELNSSAERLRTHLFSSQIIIKLDTTCNLVKQRTRCPVDGSPMAVATVTCHSQQRNFPRFCACFEPLSFVI